VIAVSLRFLRHPFLFTRKALGRIRRQIVAVPEFRVVLINGTVRYEHRRLPFLDEGDYRAMLTGTYDIILCNFMRRHLTAGDIALDVGGNVGYISAVAASCVGKSGEVHSFEPLHECFERLALVHRMNPDFRIICNQFALGSDEGSLPICFDPVGQSRNATLVPGYEMPVRYQVPVKRLDAYIREVIKSPERIKLIKIDVEGFELAVLKGLERFLADNTYRPLIIVEIKPWEVTKIGHDMKEFQDYMGRFGYKAYDMVDENIGIDLPSMRDMEVVVFRA
jgi:FkbM family methyltransferase